MTTRHPIDSPYTPQKPQSLCLLAHEEGVEQGGHYNARSTAITVWSSHYH